MAELTPEQIDTLAELADQRIAEAQAAQERQAAIDAAEGVIDVT